MSERTAMSDEITLHDGTVLEFRNSGTPAYVGFDDWGWYDRKTKTHLRISVAAEQLLRAEIAAREKAEAEVERQR